MMENSIMKENKTKKQKKHKFKLFKVVLITSY